MKKHYLEPGGDTLVLEAFGSITDPREFDQEVLKKVLRIAVEKGKFDSIIIETHVTQIYDELLSFIDSINNGEKEIMFEIGVEDMDSENRKLINKLGVEDNKIQEVYEKLLKHNLGLNINLIYGFPFMSESERIESVVCSLKKIGKNLPKADATLFLMSIKGNTILEYMQRKSYYRLPNPWGLVEITKRILEDEELEASFPPSFAWFGEKESIGVTDKTCYTCKVCKKRIIEFFRKINGTFNNQERRKLLEELLDSNEDNCYQEFLDSLEKERDGKTPRERYIDFLQDIAEKGEIEEGIEK